jgi:ABC-2 type transport system permease protein
LRGAVAWNDVLAPYPQLIKAGYRRYAGYRQAALAGMTTNVVFGLLRVAVLSAVLAERGSIAGYDPATAITYVWLGQGLLAVVLLWGSTEFSERVRSGDVVVDLGRPWDLPTALLATDLGRAGAAVGMRLLPPVALGALFFPFRWPDRPLTWLLFAVAVLLAVCVSFAIRLLLNMTAFWLLDGRGAVALWGAAGGMLTGLVVPLPWFPGWAQQALWWTPCPALLQGPIDVFTERVDPLPVLGHQLLWAVLLLLLVRVVLARGARRLVVHGG